MTINKLSASDQDRILSITNADFLAHMMDRGFGYTAEPLSGTWYLGQDDCYYGLESLREQYEDVAESMAEDDDIHSFEDFLEYGTAMGGFMQQVREAYSFRIDGYPDDPDRWVDSIEYACERAENELVYMPGEHEVTIVRYVASVVRTWKVYGAEGHRQRESFFPSYSYDFNKDGVKIDVMNSDQTGTNDYTIIRIYAPSAEECENELWGQISDGIFENSRTGTVEEIFE